MKYTFNFLVTSFISLSFICSTILIQSTTATGATLIQQPIYFPPQLTGIRFNPQNPFELNFLISEGTYPQSPSELQIKGEQLIRLFFTALVTDPEHLWVNLSPYEKNQMIPEQIAQTELGKILLHQDLLLKKLTANLLNPDNHENNELWNKLLTLTNGEFNSDLHKVWIIPATAEFITQDNAVLINNTRLTVQLASDINHSAIKQKKTHPKITQLMRDHLLPKIEQTINESPDFAPLRQIYHAVILAKWVKETFKQMAFDQFIAQQRNHIQRTQSKNLESLYHEYTNIFNAPKKQQRVFFNPETQILEQKFVFSGGKDFRKISLQQIDQMTTAYPGEKLELTVELNRDNGLLSFDQPTFTSLAEKREQAEKTLLFLKQQAQLRKPGRSNGNQQPLTIHPIVLSMHQAIDKAKAAIQKISPQIESDIAYKIALNIELTKLFQELKTIDQEFGLYLQLIAEETFFYIFYDLNATPAQPSRNFVENFMQSIRPIIKNLGTNFIIEPSDSKPYQYHTLHAELVLNQLAFNNPEQADALFQELNRIRQIILDAQETNTLSPLTANLIQLAIYLQTAHHVNQLTNEGSETLPDQWKLKIQTPGIFKSPFRNIITPSNNDNESTVFNYDPKRNRTLIYNFYYPKSTGQQRFGFMIQPPPIDQTILSNIEKFEKRVMPNGEITSETWTAVTFRLIQEVERIMQIDSTENDTFSNQLGDLHDLLWEHFFEIQNNNEPTNPFSAIVNAILIFLQSQHKALTELADNHYQFSLFSTISWIEAKGLIQTKEDNAHLSDKEKHPKTINPGGILLDTSLIKDNPAKLRSNLNPAIFSQQSLIYPIQSYKLHYQPIRFLNQ